MVLVRIRRSFYAPTKYLDLADDHPLSELIPSLCEQFGMFGGEDINLYRCPPVLSSSPKKEGSGLKAKSKLDNGLSLSDQAIAPGACLLLLGGAVEFDAESEEEPDEDLEIQQIEEEQSRLMEEEPAPPAAGKGGKGAFGGKGAPASSEEGEQAAAYREAAGKDPSSSGGGSSNDEDDEEEYPRDPYEDKAYVEASLEERVISKGISAQANKPVVPAFGSPVRMSAHRQYSTPQKTARESPMQTPSPGMSNIDMIAAEHPDHGTIQFNLIHSPRYGKPGCSAASFRSTTDRFAMPKSNYRGYDRVSKALKDEMMISNAEKQAWSSPGTQPRKRDSWMTRNSAEPSSPRDQDWMFNSTNRSASPNKAKSQQELQQQKKAQFYGASKGRLAANEWAPAMAATYDRN